jgi:beta-glucosidase
MHSNIYGDYFDQSAAPLFCFGHGLSFTIFDYTGLTINPSEVKPGETVEISFEIRNSGLMAGDEVVQLYLRDEYASIPRPVKELKGFKRLHLKPGESRRITFHLDTRQLAYYDENLALMLESGQFTVMVGSSSDDLRLTGTINLAGKAKYPVKDRVFVCPVTVK